jgi:hypothetical protein
MWKRPWILYNGPFETNKSYASILLHSLLIITNKGRSQMCSWDFSSNSVGLTTSSALISSMKQLTAEAAAIRNCSQNIFSLLDVCRQCEFQVKKCWIQFLIAAASAVNCFILEIRALDVVKPTQFQLKSQEHIWGPSLVKHLENFM